MRRLVRNVPFQAVGRNTQQAYNPEASLAKLNSWSGRLNRLSSTGQSKMYLTQLAALTQYYTKEVSDVSKNIEWADWKSRIITEGLVDKVQKNYEEQSSQQYNLDGIFNQIFGKDSKTLDDINNQMSFHTALWTDVYADYAFFLHDLNSVSALSDYNVVEWHDLHPGYEVLGQALIETHCFFPGARSDVDLYGYISKQFTWGKKVFTFYRHPSDNNNALKATKNAMGR